MTRWLRWLGARALRSKFPLTEFVVNMMGATNEQLLKLNPEKMAARYGISEKHVREYVAQELIMRGVRREKPKGNS